MTNESILDERWLPAVPSARHGTVTVPATERPEPHEIDTMRRLSHLGRNVLFRAVSTVSGTKNPDLLLDGHLWEMKSPAGTGKSTISHQFERARKQADRLVHDLTRTALLDADVLAEVRRRIARDDAKIREVIVIFKDQTGLLLARSPLG